MVTQILLSHGYANTTLTSPDLNDTIYLSFREGGFVQTQLRHLRHRSYPPIVHEEASNVEAKHSSDASRH